MHVLAMSNLVSWFFELFYKIKKIASKIFLQDWQRNNRGINDGADLPEEYMSKLYESIVFNEIKMKVSWSIIHISFITYLKKLAGPKNRDRLAGMLNWYMCSYGLQIDPPAISCEPWFAGGIMREMRFYSNKLVEWYFAEKTKWV